MKSEYIDTPEAYRRLVDRLVACDKIAIDTEFHRERFYFPRVALIQVAWAEGSALIDPQAVDVSDLAQIWRSADTLSVMHACEQDLDVMAKFCGGIPARLFDTQIAAGFLGHGTPSLENLLYDELKLRIPKGDRLTDWTIRPLTDAQQRYAAADVDHLLELHSRLTRQLQARSRDSWVTDECEQVLANYHLLPNFDQLWWRLKGSRRLRGPARGVAQSLMAWRERVAVDEDVPPRYITSDLACMSIVQRQPVALDQLAGIRGLDARGLRSEWAIGVVDAVRRGRDLTEAELCIPPSPDGVRTPRALIALVTAWVQQRASDLDIDTARLATRADVQSYLSGSSKTRLADGWRRDELAGDIDRLAAGTAGVTCGSDGRLKLVDVAK